jgi:glycosyltransferase involved in cell wall biosynthesis
MNAGASPRICMVGAFPPPVHGMAMVNAEMREELDRRKKTPLVLNLAAATLKRDAATRASRIRSVARGLFAYGRVLSRGGGDTLYVGLSGGWGQLYEAAFVALGRLRRARVFLHHHSFAYIDKTSVAAMLLTRVAGANARHIVLCDEMASGLRERYRGVAHTSVVSNAALIARTSVGLAPKKRLRAVGFLGNISAAKGIMEVLAVARQIGSHGINVRIAGPFENEQVRASVDHATQTHHHVQYLGPMYGAAKDAYWSEIDVLLFPSKYVNEAAPLVVLEAMAHGIPVIAWERGCLSCMVTSDSGLVIARGDDFVTGAVSRILRWKREPHEFEECSRATLAQFASLRDASSATLAALLDAITDERGVVVPFAREGESR